MRKQATGRYLLLTSLIISSLLFAGYRLQQQNGKGSEICTTKECKDQEKSHLQSAIPIWESVSRHFIAFQ